MRILTYICAEITKQMFSIYERCRISYRIVQAYGYDAN